MAGCITEVAAGAAWTALTLRRSHTKRKLVIGLLDVVKHNEAHV